MRVCKFRNAFLGAASIILFQGICAAQGIGSVTSPTITTITAPTLGGGFYLPSSTTNPAYTGGYGSQGSSVSADEKKPGSQTETFIAEDTEDGADLRALAEALSIPSTITANDLSSLNSMGLLNGVSAADLGQVLTHLEGIKKLSGSASADKSSDAQTAGTAGINRSDAQAVPQSRLLRFTVNGYDVLKTCRTVYISDVQSDGTFLVTGDRRYLSDGIPRSETFHMLFTASQSSRGATNYTAQTAVTQDYFNRYSFMYELSQMSELGATRTGNFVSMRTDDPQFKLELLIDLGERNSKASNE